ncbi:MAG: GAF domain-containing SpoIIE family protein phosphatase [Bacteroidota bacterium]
MSIKLKIRLSFLGGLICWLLFSASNIYLLFIESYEMKVQLSDFIPQLFLTGFVLTTFAYYRYKITKADTLNFTDLLWKVFITGLITTLFSLGIRFFFTIFSNSSIVESPLTVNFFYNILIALVLIFMISTFVVWKRLILYQKSKTLIQLWSFFEIALILSLLYDFLNIESFSTNFNIGVIVLTCFSIVLVFNLKWVAYLNFRQKWKGILFILLSGIYLYHFFLNLESFRSTNVLVIDLLDRVFIIGLLEFLFLYAAISILVTLFNLPTSSVFERKLKEALDFQKLSQSIPRGETIDQTYEILLESSMSAVFADAAWLEAKSENETFLSIQNLDEKEIDHIKSKVKSSTIQDIINFNFKKELHVSKLADQIKHVKFKSIIALPIHVQEKQIGYIVLLNEVLDAFNSEMVSIITTFVNQASISIENLELIKESLENERYKEQLKIAKNVQKSLLPNELNLSSCFQIEAFSMAADEVGGDYYDLLQTGDNQYSLIISDVSGKGTSAAFQMAQMKGIFHSLASQSLSPEEFNIQANIALSHCLEKSSFITATIFNIDTDKRTIALSRAGHCPSLMYCSQKDTSDFLSCDGMGLGIVRNSSYKKYVQSTTLTYEEGDTLLLYTDGITEAKDENGAQFGTERLEKSFNNYAKESPVLIKKGIINDLTTFTNEVEIDDDYTLVVIKFKSKIDG